MGGLRSTGHFLRRVRGSSVHEGSLAGSDTGTGVVRAGKGKTIGKCFLDENIKIPPLQGDKETTGGYARYARYA